MTMAVIFSQACQNWRHTVKRHTGIITDLRAWKTLTIHRHINHAINFMPSNCIEYFNNRDANLINLCICEELDKWYCLIANKPNFSDYYTKTDWTVNEHSLVDFVLQMLLSVWSLYCRENKGRSLPCQLFSSWSLKFWDRVIESMVMKPLPWNVWWKQREMGIFIT